MAFLKFTYNIKKKEKALMESPLNYIFQKIVVQKNTYPKFIIKPTLNADQNDLIVTPFRTLFAERISTENAERTIMSIVKLFEIKESCNIAFIAKITKLLFHEIQTLQKKMN